jgi:hypothetical protein
MSIQGLLQRAALSAGMRLEQLKGVDFETKSSGYSFVHQESCLRRRMTMKTYGEVNV